MNWHPLGKHCDCRCVTTEPAYQFLGQLIGLSTCDKCRQTIITRIPEVCEFPLLLLDRQGLVYDPTEPCYFPQTNREQMIAEAFSLTLPANGYPLRKGQRCMAVAVERALGKEGVLLADAGVGIGKSFAYLLPILFRNRGLYVISTSTLVLQDQLARDAAVLAELLGKPLPDIVVCKGERNYVCRYRLERNLSAGRIPKSVQGEAKKALEQLAELQGSEESDKIGAWNHETTTSMAISPSLRNHVVVDQRTPNNEDRSNCDICPYADLGCGFRFMQSARTEQVWGELRLLVVNHGLLLQDLQFRLDRGDAGLWPHPDGIIIDEAHDLESKARAILTVAIVPDRIGLLTHTLSSTFPDARPRIDELEREARKLDLVNQQARRVYQEPDSERIPLTNAVRSRLEGLCNAAEGVQTAIYAQLYDARALNRSQQNALRMLEEWVTCASRIFSGDPGVAAAIEGCAVTAAPGEVRKELWELLFSRNMPIILCSGTLLAGASFEELGSDLGVPVQRRMQLRAESPFDYQARMRLFTSCNFPLIPRSQDQKEMDYVESFLYPTVSKLLETSQGRALILCTSRRRAKMIYDHLSQQDHFRVLWQDEPNTMEQFCTLVDSVLVGTGKLFMGIDVPGEALSLLILDRIPFPVPDDPLYQAKEALALAVGKSKEDSIWAWARTALAQGAGRLIRSLEDWGVMAILDPRAAPSGKWHDAVQLALPKGTWVQTIGDVAGFFRQGPGVSSSWSEAPPREVLARRCGSSPRACYGFSPDVRLMMNMEDPYSQPQIFDLSSSQVPDGKAPVILCAAIPHIRRYIQKLVAIGRDVAVATVRDPEWAEYLTHGLGLPGCAWPSPELEPWLFLAAPLKYATEPDRAEVAEACTYQADDTHLILTADESQMNSVREHLTSQDLLINGRTTISLWEIALKNPSIVSNVSYITILDLPRQKVGEIPHEDIARFIALTGFDGRLRCLFVASPVLVSMVDNIHTMIGTKPSFRGLSMSKVRALFKEQRVRHSNPTHLRTMWKGSWEQGVER